MNFLDVFKRAKPPASTSNASPPEAIATELASYIWDLQFRIDTNLTAHWITAFVLAQSRIVFTEPQAKSFRQCYLVMSKFASKL